jgi:hypothetical protein
MAGNPQHTRAGLKNLQAFDCGWQLNSINGACCISTINVADVP